MNCILKETGLSFVGLNPKTEEAMYQLQLIMVLSEKELKEVINDHGSFEVVLKKESED